MGAVAVPIVWVLSAISRTGRGCRIVACDPFLVIIGSWILVGFIVLIIEVVEGFMLVVNPCIQHRNNDVFAGVAPLVSGL